MPRRSKGARLQLKAARRDKSGKITHQATWIIRDNGRDVGTGCAADEIVAAERKLENYIASKYTPKRRVRHIDDIPIADVLSIYLDARLEKFRDRFEVDSESETPSQPYRNSRAHRATERGVGCEDAGEVNGRRVALIRRNANRGGARRDPGRLARSHWSSCHRRFSRKIVRSGCRKRRPRDKWLTRGDAAKLVWACCGIAKCRGSRRRNRRCEGSDSEASARHLAPSSCSGLQRTRAEAIPSASPFRRLAFLLSILSATLLSAQAGRREDKQAWTDGPIFVAPACASAALAPD